MLVEMLALLGLKGVASVGRAVDESLTVQLDDCCELFINGENDYKRFLKEEVI